LSEHVRVERAGGVLSITLARPERRNAITVAMYAALGEAIETAANDDTIRLITLRGEGQDFAAGNDLGDFLAALPRDTGEIPVWRFLRALATCEIPLVTLLHCDLVIAAEDTRFSLPFVDLALVPEAASTLLIPRIAGRRRAARYLLLAEPFGVDEALSIGLVSHRAAAGELDNVLSDVVSRLLAKAPAALRQTQRLLRAGTSEEVLARMKLESDAFAERLASAEAKEAFTAFFEKRKPNFGA
jgi:enoyl-CoA hydratase/carnithine racemase